MPPTSARWTVRICSFKGLQDRADFQKVIDGASLAMTDFEDTYRLQLPDGRVKHVHAIAHAMQNASGDREFVGAVSDITRRKTTEDKIRRLVEAGTLGIFIANLEGEIVEANQAFLQMFQYDRQDLLSGRLRWEDMTPAELRERDQRAVTEALATGFFQPYEKQFFRKDGSRLPVLLGGALFEDSNEGVSFVLDLSEQKRAEAKIREQEVELRQIVDLVAQLVAVFGPGGERLYANRIGLDYVGLSFEEWRQAPGTFFSSRSIHPDDRARAGDYFDRALSAGSVYELESRLRKGDGTCRWFLVRFNPWRDEQGQIARWYVALTDIEERKWAEEKVREQESELRQMLNLSPQQVAVYGPAGERLYTNRVVLDYIGLSLEEWRQTSGSFLLSPTLQEKIRREILVACESANWRLGGPEGAAARLGLKRTTLFHKMRRLGIARPTRRAVAASGESG